MERAFRRGAAARLDRQRRARRRRRGLAPARRPGRDVIPSTVQTIYAAQLDDLPAGPRQVVRRASVPGRRFPSDALEHLGVEGADENLAVLERRALVAGPDPDPVFGSIYAYRHALLRDAGYASLPRAERADLVRLARWLEGLGGALAEVIGRHYAAAVESAPRLAQEVAPGLTRAEAAAAAAHWFEAGARTAHELAAHETAAALLEAVAATRRRRRHRRGAPPPAAGEVLAEGGDMDQARAELDRARELAASLAGEDDGRTEYAAATAALGRVANQQVRFAEAEQLAEDALAFLGERRTPRPRSFCSSAEWAAEWARTRSRSPRATRSARSSSRGVPATRTSSSTRACSGPRPRWIPHGPSRTSPRCGRSGVSGAAG